MSQIIDNLKEDLRKNPVPTAITGLGLACAIGQTIQAAFRKPPKPPTFRERCSSAVDDAKDKVAHIADAAKEKVRGATDAVTEKAGEVKNSLVESMPNVESTTSKTKKKVQRLVKEKPYMCGAGVIATGFIVGLIIPPSRVEKEMFGEKGKQLIDDAKAAGKEALEEGKALAKETVAAADEAVREAAEDTGETVREKLATV